ncbi:hypothetical protein [Xanthomonas euroxanthea]|uniref:hypothetical protein n=2 Tax=Xanthomonas TaxID=338 RepID=UPI000CEE64E1|nr:hypothetical protein [Xanthomonas euroxanthea]PPT33330.1 hypothetical protein XaCFBP7622_01275 [Xanthomonas arboricola]
MVIGVGPYLLSITTTCHAHRGGHDWDVLWEVRDLRERNRILGKGGDCCFASSGDAAAIGRMMGLGQIDALFAAA